MNLKHVFPFFVLVFMISACVTEFAFEEEVENFVVVDGVISNSLDERRITVSKTTGISSLPQRLEASGNVYRDGELWAALQVDSIGELSLEPNYLLEEGRSYYVEISTEDGNIYRSFPQIVQPKASTDSISFQLVEKIEGFSFNGNPISKPFIDVYAHLTIATPAAGKLGPNYKYQVSESWLVEEKYDSIENPTPIFCYPEVGVSAFPVNVVKSEDASPGQSIQVLAASRLLDESFLHKHYFNLYLHTVDFRAIDFYEKASSLSVDRGTLYDEVPGRLEGNIKNVNDEDDFVLGYVEFSLADTSRILIDVSQINYQLYKYCEDYTTDCRNYPTPCFACVEGRLVRISPCICYECDTLYGLHVATPPPYWGE